MEGLQAFIIPYEIRTGLIKVIPVSAYTAERSLKKAALNTNSQTKIFLFSFLDLDTLNSVFTSGRTLKSNKFQI